jgi:hypothetical protein
MRLMSGWIGYRVSQAQWLKKYLHYLVIQFIESSQHKQSYPADMFGLARSEQFSSLSRFTNVTWCFLQWGSWVLRSIYHLSWTWLWTPAATIRLQAVVTTHQFQRCLLQEVQFLLMFV